MNKEIPYGYCQCGCGQKTNIAKQTDKRDDVIKGQPMRFVFGHAVDKARATRWHAPLTERIWSKVQKRGPDECWEWQGSRNSDQYGRIRVNGRTVNATRVIYELLHGPISAGMVVCHRCDNPPCCNPAHFFIGTPADNYHDRDVKGRGHQRFGSDNGQAKLNDSQVQEIRSLCAAGIRYADIALRFHVTGALIGQIARRKVWRRVK